MFTSRPRKPVHLSVRLTVIVALLSTVIALRSGSSADAVTPTPDPYAVTPAVDADPAPRVFETTIVAKPATLDIGNGVPANMWTFNGTVPGPELRVQVGDTVVVHYRNELPLPSSIHWHGIELNNASDGTELTQNAVPTGGSYLYRFTVPRPGVYWYHPHHHPTNQVFRGMYGSLIVEDPYDDVLRSHNVLPPRANTKTLVLSDTTVCKDPGTNDTDTYDDSLPWAGGGPLPEQPRPFPSNLCDTPRDDDGNRILDATGRPIPLRKGDIPNIQQIRSDIQVPEQGRTNEGQTVLANGRNRGARAGTPEAPGALASGAETLAIPAGQGLRLQAINSAAIRYFRLRLTDSAGRRIPLVRVGGQGGLLDAARLEGGKYPAPLAGQEVESNLGDVSEEFDTKFERGELVLGPSQRVDFVAAVPADATGVATLWTLDYSRTGNGFTWIPTVPVMHLDVTAPTAERYTIAEGTPLRTHPAVADPTEHLGPPLSPLPPLADLSGQISPLLDPASFPTPKPGSASEEIKMTTNGTAPSIDFVVGTHDRRLDYTALPHLTTTRYARVGDLLELNVTNTADSHHVFHLHGFSFQPRSFEPWVGTSHVTLPVPHPLPNYVFQYNEFVDSIDLPPKSKLRMRVRLDDRPLMDGITPGGAIGRWAFHCHIFFHATQGMHSELVVVAPDGNEKPNVDSSATVVAASEGAVASTTGRFSDPDGDATSVTASSGDVVDTGGGTWRWTAGAGAAGVRTVYITATDARGFRNQTAFQVSVANVAPEVSITSPPDGAAFAAGSAVTVAADVSDPGGGPVACRFDWDDGGGAGPPIAAVDGQCRDTRILARPDIHTIGIVASDAVGGTGSDTVVVAVYDPAAGFLTGSGTIASPAGSATASPSAAGEAAFDIMARYPKGATTPAGNLVFSFQAAGFELTSTDLAWLVVKGGTTHLRGSAVAADGASYQFLLTARDGAVTAVDARDRLRLKVWEAGPTPRVVYDNAPALTHDVDGAHAPAISLGSIVVHRRDTVL